jgi:hypothetical protein
MSLSAELLNINIEFLKRVDLKGGEVPAFVALQNELMEMLQAAEVPAEVPLEQESPEAA